MADEQQQPANDGVYRIPTNPVSSSNIAELGYDDEKGILAVVFKSGAIYHYAVSADLALDLLHADSIGRFYSTQIKGKFTGQKMTGHCPRCGVQARVGEVCPDCGCDLIAEDPPKEAHAVHAETAARKG
jgi:hypothetical protein